MEPIKIHIPHTKQLYEYDCGAAVVMSVCKYNLIDIKLKNLSILLKTNHNGTKVANILKTLNLFKIKHKEKYNMDVNELCHIVNLGSPVICPLQAWGCGHYVIAIGYDKENIYFEDPYMKDTRGFIKKIDLLERWKDTGCDGEKYNRYGIILSKNSPQKIEVLTKVNHIPYNIF